MKTNLQYLLADGRVGTFKGFQFVGDKLMLVFAVGKETITIGREQIKHQI